MYHQKSVFFNSELETPLKRRVFVINKKTFFFLKEL